jgi:hypothetical protein
MVQPFMPEVQTLGEWSLIFLGGGFSHSVRKFPAPGNFLVHSEFGGTVQATPASSHLVEKASMVLRFQSSPPQRPLLDPMASPQNE